MMERRNVTIGYIDVIEEDSQEQEKPENSRSRPSSTLNSPTKKKQKPRSEVNNISFDSEKSMNLDTTVSNDEPEIGKFKRKLFQVANSNGINNNNATKNPIAPVTSHDSSKDAPRSSTKEVLKFLDKKYVEQFISSVSKQNCGSQTVAPINKFNYNVDNADYDQRITNIAAKKQLVSTLVPL
jgi:hypothetical protein